MIQKRLNLLRQEMIKLGMTYYIIPTSDYHASEYIGEFFKQRRYMSGFTGSVGTLLVGLHDAYLWCDGRYHLQAEQELENSTITLMRYGLEGVLPIDQFLANTLKAEDTLGFDGRYLSANFMRQIKSLLPQSVRYITNHDLVGMIWNDRPLLSNEACFLVDPLFIGETRKSKLYRIRNKMKEVGANIHLMTTLDDIAWTFNLRGHDIVYNPVTLAYVLITMDHCYLFMNEHKLSSEIKNELETDQITILPYDDIEDFLKKLAPSSIILLDEDKVNYSLVHSLPASLSIVNMQNPSLFMKSIKNDAEIMALKNAHLKDGIAVTKFMYWLKTNIGKIPMDEISASEYMLAKRKEQPGFIEPSFNTICAYQDHAAMMHYSATKDSSYPLAAKDLLLIDSGGQYVDGTTDITRTYALGPISEQMRHHYTLVLKGMLNLAMAKFLYEVRGLNLDILARRPMWNEGIDYRSGTGHGVGFLLNVHEAPNGFRWKVVPERNDSATFEEGMITTDEPGIYLDHQYGIRTENELLCIKGIKNEYGQFMEFETITYAPIDLDAIDETLLTQDEKNFLNAYHQNVYRLIAPHLDDEERVFLRKYTKAL